jgi:hypothetical protein
VSERDSWQQVVQELAAELAVTNWVDRMAPAVKAARASTQALMAAAGSTKALAKLEAVLCDAMERQASREWRMMPDAPWARPETETYREAKAVRKAIRRAMVAARAEVTIVASRGTEHAELQTRALQQCVTELQHLNEQQAKHTHAIEQVPERVIERNRPKGPTKRQAQRDAKIEEHAKLLRDPSKDASIARKLKVSPRTVERWRALLVTRCRREAGK